MEPTSEPPAPTIQRLLDAARARSGATLFLVGGPGLGKTRWAAHAAHVAGRDFLVATATADPRESRRPLAFLELAMHALAAASGTFRGREPDLGSRGAAPERARRLILSLAQEPVLLVLDDAHWSDPASLDALSYLARRVAFAPVMLLATLRPHPPAAQALALRLAGERAASVTELRPLTLAEATGTLQERSGRRWRAGRVKTAWAACAGNPLLLEQVAVGSLPEAGPDELSRRVLVARLVAPNGAERAYADAAAVVGLRFPLAAVPVIARLADADADAALTALAVNGLVTSEEPGHARFTAPLLRRLLYDSLHATLRSRLHSRTLRALVEAGADAEDMLPHALESGARPEPAAAALISESAQRAVREGHVDRGRQLLEAALRISGRRPDPVLVITLAQVLLAVGGAEEAVRSLRAVLRQPETDPSHRVAAGRTLGRALLALGRRQEGVAALEAAAKEAVAVGGRGVAESLIDFGEALWLTEGAERATTVIDHALSVVEVVAPELEPPVVVASAFTRVLGADLTGVAAAEAALLTAALQPEPAVRLFETGWPAVPTYIQMTSIIERFADGDRVFEAALRDLPTAPLPGRLALARADALRRQARLGSAREVARDARRAARLEGGLLPWTLVLEAELDHDLGLFREAWQVIAAATEAGAAQAPPLLALRVQATRASLLTRAGRVEEACQAFSAVESLAMAAGIREPCAVPWTLDAIKAYLAGGRRADAERVTDILDAAIEEVPCVWPRLARASAAAVLARDSGDDDQALESYRSAGLLIELCPLPLASVELLIDFGRFLRQTGRPREARPYLTRALLIADEVGAAWHVRQAHQELRAAGGRRRSARDLNALTMQETRVAALAAEGLGNAEIARQLGVSAKTIETHLGAVYRKLNLRSRRELMMLQIAERRRA